MGTTDQVVPGKFMSPIGDERTKPTVDTDFDVLRAFHAIPSINKVVSTSFRQEEGVFNVVVATSQVNLHTNAKRKYLSTVCIPNTTSAIVTDWPPLPFEISGASLIAPYPRGAKALIIRNAKDATSPMKLEI